MELAIFEVKQQNNGVPLTSSKKEGSYDRGEPVEFENNRLKFKTAGKLPVCVEEFIEYSPI